MSGLAKAMWRQAERDLDHARRSLAFGHFEWAGFAAQQAAEKALKALLLAGGHPAPPLHNLGILFDALVRAGYAGAGEKEALQETLLGLSQTWAIARYPAAEMETAPADLLTEGDARTAIARAETVLALVRDKGVEE